MLEFETPLPMNCVLCGKPIAPGEPCYVVLTGLVVDDHNFNDNQSLGLACSCLLRAAEQQAIDHMADPNIPLRERIARTLDKSAEHSLKEAL